ncbi:Archaeal putative transposase ISC1217 [Metallosphaera yellowstonensis MK1]|uniref:Archaeal putative transposase ISC1217 n=1 Tax=Metallosphaera yellowstonensis MK1 TaxID=671065 RepID=H2C595_9CREN|nr:Archaeal putative transposase ISC1217 [Metallosphaera yellowstonensis MK1]
MGFVRVTEFKAKIEVARCWTCSRSTSACPGSSSTPVPSEKLVTDNVVSRLKSNRAQVLPRTPSRRGTSQWDTPGVYYADLTLGGRVVMVKLLVREHDSGIHVRYLYTTDLSLSEEEAWRMRWEIEDLQGTSRPWDWSTRPSGGGRGFRATSRSSP